MTLSIRPSSADDIPIILQFIRELAEYEKLLDEVVATEDVLRASLFGDAPKAFCVIAQWDGVPVGFALYFYNFSTFLGKPGMYVEDLYVQPELRGKGIGKALLAHLAKQALEEGCGRLEWWVLDWNEPSINFYRSLNAEAMDEWTVFRLAGAALHALASG